MTREIAVKVVKVRVQGHIKTQGNRFLSKSCLWRGWYFANNPKKSQGKWKIQPDAKQISDAQNLGIFMDVTSGDFLSYRIPMLLMVSRHLALGKELSDAQFSMLFLHMVFQHHPRNSPEFLNDQQYDRDNTPHENEHETQNERTTEVQRLSFE